MKEDVFNKYVDKVTDLFNIDRETLFSRTKQRKIVDARQLLYYLCHKRKMQLVIIKDLMVENGASIHHNSISNGIKNVKIKFEEDRDYKSVIKELENSVFI